MKNKSVIFFALYVLSLQPASAFSQAQVSDADSSYVSAKPITNFKLVGEWIVVAAEINGVKANFILDNGVSEIMLFKKFAKENNDSLKLKFYPQIKSMSYLAQFPETPINIAEGKVTVKINTIYFQNTNQAAYTTTNHKINDFVEILSGDLNLTPQGIDGIIPLRLFYNGDDMLKIDNVNNQIYYINHSELPSNVEKYTCKQSLFDAITR